MYVWFYSMCVCIKINSFHIYFKFILYSIPYWFYKIISIFITLIYVVTT